MSATDRIAMQHAAVLKVSEVVRLLPWRDSEVKAWLRSRKLIRSVDGHPVVLWGDVLSTIRAETDAPTPSKAPKTPPAEPAADYLHRRLMEHGVPCVSRRDMQRLTDSRFGNVRALQTAIDALVKAGKLCPLAKPLSNGGRPRSQRYVVEEAMERTLARDAVDRSGLGRLKGEE